MPPQHHLRHHSLAGSHQSNISYSATGSDKGSEYIYHDDDGLLSKFTSYIWVQPRPSSVLETKDLDLRDGDTDSDGEIESFVDYSTITVEPNAATQNPTGSVVDLQPPAWVQASGSVDRDSPIRRVSAKTRKYIPPVDVDDLAAKRKCVCYSVLGAMSVCFIVGIIIADAVLD